MADNLKKEPELRLETVNGGLGELSVSIDGVKVFEGNRLWYPTPTSIIQKVRAALVK